MSSAPTSKPTHSPTPFREYEFLISLCGETSEAQAIAALVLSICEIIFLILFVQLIPRNSCWRRTGEGRVWAFLVSLVYYLVILVLALLPREGNTYCAGYVIDFNHKNPATIMAITAIALSTTIEAIWLIQISFTADIPGLSYRGRTKRLRANAVQPVKIVFRGGAEPEV